MSTLLLIFVRQEFQAIIFISLLAGNPCWLELVVVPTAT